MTKFNQEWNNIWSKRTVEQEIRMRDFYSGRQYILKYLPRYGKVIEAGCGLGRYVFYLSDLGFNTIGVDISKESLKMCKEWGKENRYSPSMFKYADVRNLPLSDNYFSGYVSLGVIEHFKEGPEKALGEAYRVLKGGGIAIISTPNRYSLEFLFQRAVKWSKSLIKHLLSFLKLYKYKQYENAFFQYEYSAKELASFIKNIGFKMIEQTTIDLKYPIYQLFKAYNRLKTFRRFVPSFFPVINFLEKTPLRLFGGLSIVIAYKPSQIMQCFFCGQAYLTNSLHIAPFSVPICESCLRKVPPIVLSRYRKGRKASFNLYTPTDYHLHRQKTQKLEKCSFCGANYLKNKHFDNYGFSITVCPECLKKPRINIKLVNFNMKEVWREYNRSRRSR